MIWTTKCFLEGKPDQYIYTVGGALRWLDM